MADPADPGITETLADLASFRDAEMARVARVLHDEIGPVLSAAGLHLDVLRMDFREQTPEAASRTAEIQRLLERAIERLRDLSYDLNPDTVDRAGLEAALERLAGRVRETFSGAIRVTFDPRVRVPKEVARRVFQIVECAIEHAVRSGANQIDIHAGASEGNIIAEISDNGSGFSKKESEAGAKGPGLALVRLYARLGGLSLKIEKRDEQGTIVRVCYPASTASFRKADGISG